MNKPKNPDHFDHDDHLDRLERASLELESLGKHDLAGAVRRARVLHTNMRGRVAHARQALARFKRLDREMLEIKGLLERYVAQPEAPWILPAPTLFPLDQD